ncbi:hypothetical protein DENSPDRAFT_527218 [Dentipellis sp. KUC8613]|nr:hypothetical protein DENSPDRAFT_527218 [Dentipellis sp. KUC8613]
MFATYLLSALRLVLAVSHSWCWRGRNSRVGTPFARSAPLSHGVKDVLYLGHRSVMYRVRVGEWLLIAPRRWIRLGRRHLKENIGPHRMRRRWRRYPMVHIGEAIGVVRQWLQWLQWRVEVDVLHGMVHERELLACCGVLEGSQTRSISSYTPRALLEDRGWS